MTPAPRCGLTADGYPGGCVREPDHGGPCHYSLVDVSPDVADRYLKDPAFAARVNAAGAVIRRRWSGLARRHVVDLALDVVHTLDQLPPPRP